MKDSEIRQDMKEDYPLIPMSEIEAEARLLAVEWGEKYFPGIALEEKIKLASDFMNYARRINNKRKERL
jgi:hypothetical protein